MKTLHSFSLIVAVFVCLATPLIAASSPVWLFPAEGEVFGKSTVASYKENEGVPISLEVPLSVSGSYSAEIFAGETSLGYVGNTQNTGPRRYQATFRFSTAGTYTLSAKINDGFTAITIAGPTIQIVSPYPAPTFHAEAPTHISALGVDLRAGVDVHGAGVTTAVFEYGTTTAYGKTVTTFPDSYAPGVVHFGAGIGARRGFRPTPLQPETEYHYRLVVDGLVGPDNVFVTPASLPPQANEDILVLNADGVAEGDFLRNDTDDGFGGSSLPFNWFTLVSVSTPAHGQVQVSLAGNVFRYTADSTFESTDEFTYTIRDPSGGEATGRVVVRGIRAHFAALSGNYASVVVNDNNVPIGTFTLQITKDERYTGAIIYFRQRFTISGRFTSIEDLGTVDILLGREGRPPLNLVFGIYLGDDNVPTLFGSLEGGGDGSFQLPETPQSVPHSENVPEAGEFNIALANPNVVENDNAPAPDEEDLFGLPQGHGFARMKVSRNGSLQVIGKLPDNRPFTVGSHIRKDRKGIINSKVSTAKKGTLFGLVGFDLASKTGGTGDLTWNNPESQSGSYRSEFSTTVGAAGKAFTPAIGRAPVFEFPAGSLRPVQITVRNHAGGIIAQQTRNLDAHNRLNSDPGAAQRIQIAIDPQTGLFTGKVTERGKPTIPLTGITQPMLRRGVGISGKTGFEGTVEILAL